MNPKGCAKERINSEKREKGIEKKGKRKTRPTARIDVQGIKKY